MDFSVLGEGREKWRNVVNTVTNNWGPLKFGDVIDYPKNSASKEGPSFFFLLAN